MTMIDRERVTMRRGNVEKALAGRNTLQTALGPMRAIGKVGTKLIRLVNAVGWRASNVDFGSSYAGVISYEI